MIDNKFWINVAANWSLENDGIDIPNDFSEEAEKAKGISADDIGFYDDVSNDEIDDILADLGLNDI